MSFPGIEGNPTGFQTAVNSIVLTLIAGIFVFIRVVNRLVILKSFAADDGLILCALALSIVFTVLNCLDVEYGSGKPQVELSPAQARMLFKLLWASIPTYQLSLFLTKMSLLLQYHRIFNGRRAHRVLYALMGVVVAYGFWSVGSTLFMCIPISAFWHHSRGRCLSQLVVWFINAAINIATDIAIFIYPMPLIKQLQLPKRQRYWLIGVFALGGFVCLTSVLRLHSLYDLSVATDKSEANGPIARWTAIELNVGILCATLPTLKNLAARIMPSYLRPGSDLSRPRYCRPYATPDLDHWSQEPTNRLEKLDSVHLNYLPERHVVDIGHTPWYQDSESCVSQNDIFAMAETRYF